MGSVAAQPVRNSAVVAKAAMVASDKPLGERTRNTIRSFPSGAMSGAPWNISPHPYCQAMGRGKRVKLTVARNLRAWAGRAHIMGNAQNVSRCGQAVDIDARSD